MKETGSSIFSFEALAEPEPLAWKPEKKGSAKKHRLSSGQPPKAEDGFFSNVRDGKNLSLKDETRLHAIGENAKRLRRLLTASPQKETPRWVAEQLAAIGASLRRRYREGDRSALSLIIASEDPKEPWIIQEPWFKEAILHILKEVLPAIPREWDGPSTEEVIALYGAFSEGKRFYQEAKKALKDRNNSTTIKRILAQQLNRPEEEIERLVSSLSDGDEARQFKARLDTVVKGNTLRRFAEKWAALHVGWAHEKARRCLFKLYPSPRQPHVKWLWGPGCEWALEFDPSPQRTKP